MTNQTVAGQVEFKTDTDGQALMRIKESGVVALYFAHRPKMSTPAKAFFLDRTGRKYGVGTVYREGENKVAAWPLTSVRFHQGTYNLRGTNARPSDRVFTFERWISGRLYTVTRMWWPMDKVTTVRLYDGTTTTVLKSFTYEGK
jgi:hypothetical protein